MIDSSANQMLAPDTVLQGRYRVVRQLGQGGMGAVYEAIDERLDTTVALKETLFSDERLRKQFEREARMLARLHHQALPRVSDHFNEGDGQFLVMQFIPGEDLFEMLARRKSPFTQEEVLQWADQLCDALDYLHTQDPPIIHRDIKPQNLKLSTRGQVVLLDFGLAKGSAGQMSVVTTSASIFGYTPNYAPLEQVQGMGTDSRSDIYALAATLFHLLTNVKPPDALSRAAALVNGEPDPLPMAHQVSAQASAAVAAVLAKGMSQKRDERFSTAMAMRDALREAAENPLSNAATVMNTTARPATVTGRPATHIASGHTQAMASEARTLVAPDVTNVRAKSADEAATLVRPAPPRSNRTWLAGGLVLLLLVGGAVGFYAYRKRLSGQANNGMDPTNQNQPIKSVEVGNPPNNAATNSNNPVTSSSPSTPVQTRSEKGKPETAQRNVTRKTEVKAAETEKPVTPRTKTDSGHGERNSDRGRDSFYRPPPGQQPSPPNVQPPNVPSPGHPNGRPEMRTFPDGTRVLRNPDGSRVVIFPNGQTRVIPAQNQRKRP
jgi:eukaryotic-like serine/threonine-protein kinase